MSQINTVSGPISPEGLGITAMHEHIQFGMPGWDKDPWVEYDRAVEFEKIKNDLVDFKEAGGTALVDCSGMTLGRDVEFYRNLSRVSGVHIVACTGSKCIRLWCEALRIWLLRTSDILLNFGLAVKGPLFDALFSAKYFSRVNFSKVL